MLCKKCREDSDEWLFYKPGRPLRIHEGATFDGTKRGISQLHQARLSGWRETVKFQQALIARQCVGHEMTS